ncbi:F0F1 ATP synthase subunit I [Silicimonas algicola]|jgi:ATP synthase protein I|uniref:ATP synthase protein I n=1 Tax=Silicimonas algicola TaxID=1826607 RepID=A0A316GCB0_9RHOB|nr:AtpZ/AtpI family protein [Silicimonas algicola]AZQ66009.1 F0F1 ATP synthase subunit I [Silicimonas algicola]PWK58302.1 ATP synthase protein I [Silicimonas algicola]
MAETDQDRKARMEALEAKLASKRVPDAAKRHQEEHYSQLNVAWRMVIELVAGLGIGFGVGFGLDTLFGTLPWFLVVFTLLGFAAGVKTMLASAREFTPGAPGDKEGD